MNMDWRPFAGAFVQNTYEDFCKKTDLIVGDQLKAKAGAQAPLFTYQPSQIEVDMEQQRFQELQQRVIQQRRLIRQHDAQQLLSKQHRLDQLTRAKQEVVYQRRAFRSQVRSRVCVPRPATTLSPLCYAKAKPREDASGLFALTAMEDALLAGVQTTARAYQISQEQVASAIAGLRMERSTFLRRLTEMILNMGRERGGETLCQTLGLPEHVYKVLSGEMIVQPPSKRPRSPSPVQPCLESHFPDDYPVSPSASYSDEALEVYPNTAYENDPSAYPEPSAYEQVHSKVRAMYESGIDMRVIQALFGVPPILVHSWGDFARSKHCEKLKRVRALLSQKVEMGEDLREAVKGMRMTKSHAEYLLGRCDELTAARQFSEEKRKEIIDEARRAPRPGNVARKYGLPKVALHRWLRGDFSHVDGDSPFIQSEDWASASQKRRCIESFYLNKRDVDSTAAATGFTADRVAKTVDEFERRLISRAAKEGFADDTEENY